MKHADMDGWLDGWMDVQMGKQIDMVFSECIYYMYFM
jgi:hypothetical protein